MQIDEQSEKEFQSNVKDWTKIPKYKKIKLLFLQPDVKLTLLDYTILPKDVIGIIINYETYTYEITYCVKYNKYDYRTVFEYIIEFESVVVCLTVKYNYNTVISIDLFSNNRNNHMFSIIQHICGQYRFKKNTHIKCDIYAQCHTQKKYIRNCSLAVILNYIMKHKAIPYYEHDYIIENNYWNIVCENKPIGTYFIYHFYMKNYTNRYIIAINNESKLRSFGDMIKIMIDIIRKN